MEWIHSCGHRMEVLRDWSRRRGDAVDCLSGRLLTHKVHEC
jgi:hypothetical protein